MGISNSSCILGEAPTTRIDTTTKQFQTSATGASTPMTFGTYVPTGSSTATRTRIPSLTRYVGTISIFIKSMSTASNASSKTTLMKYHAYSAPSSVKTTDTFTENPQAGE